MRLYIVKEGDTLSSIAEKYGLELAQLLAINPQITDPDQIMPGMKIKIATGPVPIAPGQPEEGHPINPVGQVDTPFMQFPVPAVEAGGMTAPEGAGTQAPPSGAPSLGELTGAVGAPDNMTGQPGMSGGVQGTTPGMNGGMTVGMTGMPTGTPGAGTIGQQLGDMGTQSGWTHAQGLAPLSAGPNQNQPYLSTIPHYFAGNPMYSGVGTFGDATGSQQPAGIHAASLQSPTGMNMPAGGGNWSANIHVPYTQQMQQMTLNNWLSGGWPVEYTWSAPFEQMAMHQMNMPATTLPYPLPAKKPCGCGGGSRSQVGHYSLAEKQRAEGAQEQITEDFTAAEEARIAELEQRVASLAEEARDQVTDIQEDDAPSAEIKPTPAKRGRNRTRRRASLQKKRTPKAHVHDADGRRNKSTSYQPAGPWLNV